MDNPARRHSGYEHRRNSASTTPSCRSRSKRLDLRGRVVRLGPAVDSILTSHDYPLPVAKLLGEAIVLTRDARLGAQIRRPLHSADPERRSGAHAGGGFHRARQGARLRPLRCRTGRRPRSRRPMTPMPGKLLGHGHLAMTIDQGPDMNRYQGLVPLEGGEPGTRRARIFRALGTDTDPGAAGGGRGVPRRRQRRAATLARRRHPAAVPAQIGRSARASGRPRSRRCAAGHRAARLAGGRRLG